MSRWFRHYAGMMRDDKLVRVSIRSKQSIERVAWVWGAILESAAEIDDEGRYDVDAAEIAYFLRADQADVDGILAGLADAGRVDADRVVKWGNRQFASDRSKDRVAAHRERKRAENAGDQHQQASPDGDVTLQERHRNAPETELETETEPTSAKAVVGSARKRSASTSTGSRLDDDFAVPDDWIEWAMAERRWSRADAEAEAACFIDYWRAKPGKDGRKSDWPATWRNWVRRSHRIDGSGSRSAPMVMDDAARTAYLARLESQPWAGATAQAQPERRNGSTGPPRPIAEIASQIVGAAH